MTLVEREHLLAELATAYARAAAGHGRVVLVDGGVASGKTSVVTAVAEQAAAAGATVLTAVCSLAESRIGLGVVGQLLHELRSCGGPADAPALPGPGTSAAAAPVDTLGEGDARLFDGVCRTLLAHAADRPLVVVVDDIQFADRPSVQALLYLQRRIRCARVLLLLSGCAEAGPHSAALRADLVRQPHCRHLRLAPLSRDGVGRLLARTWRPADAYRLAAPAHALSGGNPLLVQALVRDTAAGPGTGRAPRVGEAFAAAALACLHRSDPRLLDVARALAVTGPGDPGGLVAGLTGRCAAATRQVLAALAGAGLTDDTGGMHPAVRAAVLAECPPGVLTGLRLNAARLRHEAGAPAGEVAAHLLAAGEPAPGWAVPVLTTAAATAVAAGAAGTAAEHLELALRSLPDGPRRAAVRAALVRVYWRTDPAAVPPHLPDLGDAARAGLLDPADALLTARSLAWYGRAAEAAAALAAAGDLGDHPDPELAADHRATTRWLRHCHPAGAAHPTGAAHPAGVTDPAGVADPAGAASPGAVDRATEVLQRARAGESVLVAVWQALRVLLYADDVDRAADWCERLLHEARVRRAVSWQAVLSDVGAAVALCRGDLAAAERHARAALGAMPAEAWGVAVASPRTHLVIALTMSGQLAGAAEVLGEPVPPAVRESRYWPAYLRARGLHYDALDRRHAAVADLRTAGELAVRWGADEPSALPWRVDLARVQLRAGRPDDARRLLAEHLAAPGGERPRARGMGLRVLAAAYGPKQGQAVLREALDLLHASGDRHELAHAFADLSRAGQALGDLDRAKTMGARALKLAEGCHAGLLCRTLTGPAGDRPHPRPGPAGAAALSDAERRVVNLAARGYTNREIGAKLFITTSTVEQHLTRAYRKLKVSSRTELMPMDAPEQAYA